MMFVRVLWLLGMALLVVDIAHAEPRPDFAVNGKVSGSATIASAALDGKAVFASMTATVVNLTSGYNRLSIVQAALNTIATQLSNAGQTLTQAIATLSSNSNGPIATYFDAVTSATTALRALLTGGLTTQLNTITANVQNYAASQFTDSFNTLASALTALSQTLTTMRTAVQNARNAAGNTNPIPVATMNRYVTTRIVGDVTNAVRVVNSDLPVLVYTINTTLGLLQTADRYLISVSNEAVLRAQNVVDIATNYSSSMANYVSSIEADLELGLSAPYQQLTVEYTAELEPTLSAVSGYSALFGPIFTTMDSIYSDDVQLHGVIDAAYTPFIQGAVALDSTQLAFYGYAVCTSLQSIIQVLIANGPYAQFCYNKYAQKVFNMFVINTFDTTDCYQLQLTRFEGLRSAVLDIARLIVHDIEDFIDLLEVCTLFDDMSTCISYLAGEYNTLFALTTAKRNYLEQLLQYEAQAAYFRLAACITNTEYLLILDSEQMESNIARCKLSGPLAG